MTPKRNCISKPLSKQPLALVLVQVRFSPILTIKEYIPQIQDFLRKNGYPVYSEQQNFTLEVPPVGSVSITQTAITQWRFESPALDTMILVDKEQVILQTSNYKDFEGFIENFINILGFILQITEHDKVGIFVRLGLRYVDQIKKQTTNDDIDSYLRPGLRSMKFNEYIDDKKQYSIAIIGNTKPANDFEGQLAIRVFRGEQGSDLPPDLMLSAPTNRKKVEPNEDIAMVDMDHFWIGSKGPDIHIVQTIKEMFYRLHDTIIESFHNSVISEEGINKWL